MRSTRLRSRQSLTCHPSCAAVQSRPERKNGYQKTKVDKSGLGKAIINRRKKQAVIAADPTLVSSISGVYVNYPVFEC